MPQPKKHAATRRRRNKASTAAELSPTRETVDRSGWTPAQLRAEIDRRNADRDTDERLSKAGGKAGMIAVLAEDDLDIPDLPDRDAGWHAQTRQWWCDVWSSPMSDEWHPETDWHNVIAAAMHYDDVWRAQTPADRQKADAAYVKRVAALGLTPYDRRRLEWTIETAKEARRRGERSRGSGQPPTPAAAPAAGGRVDPRAQLHAVK